jgi:hypothetical protein
MSNALELFKNDVIDRKDVLNASVIRLRKYTGFMAKILIFWIILVIAAIATVGLHSKISSTEVFINGFSHGLLLWLNFWFAIFSDSYNYLPQQETSSSYDWGFYTGITIQGLILAAFNHCKLQCHKLIASTQVLVEWLKRDLESLEILSGSTEQK